MIARRAIESDIVGILNLQDKNLSSNLSEDQKKGGFVTTPFTTKQLQNLLALDGLFVLEIEGEILGYTMAANWDYFEQWPIFPFMIGRLDGRHFHSKEIKVENSFQYGPICVAKQLRGSKAFPILFDEMRSQFSKRFDIGITFINQVNQHSYHAHIRRTNMEAIDEFEFNGQSYYSLAFDPSQRLDS